MSGAGTTRTEEVGRTHSDEKSIAAAFSLCRLEKLQRQDKAIAHGNVILNLLLYGRKFYTGQTNDQAIQIVE